MKQKYFLNFDGCHAELPHCLIHLLQMFQAEHTNRENLIFPSQKLCLLQLSISLHHFQKKFQTLLTKTSAIPSSSHFRLISYKLLSKTLFQNPTPKMASFSTPVHPTLARIKEECEIPADCYLDFLNPKYEGWEEKPSILSLNSLVVSEPHL